MGQTKTKKGMNVKKKQQIEMVADGDSGLAYGYTGDKLVCPACGKGSQTKSSLVAVPLCGGRSAGICAPCAEVVANFTGLLDLAHSLMEADEFEVEDYEAAAPAKREYLN